MEKFELKKAEAIVYYLAIEGKAGREKIASMFWGAKDENSAYNNFRNALYLLKQYFPKDFIKSDRRHVSIGTIACDLDNLDKIIDIHYPLHRISLMIYCMVLIYWNAPILAVGCCLSDRNSKHGSRNASEHV